MMDGTEFAAEYTRRPGHAPILALCAARDAAEWAASIGAVGYVAKPFDLEHLVATVAQHLDPTVRPTART
jgi:CheY-like chemotaxis protein